MKLIHAIVDNDDVTQVIATLSKEGFFSTKLSTSGGFLMSDNSTILVATEDKLVDKAIEIIKKYSKKRTQAVPPVSSYGMEMYASALPNEVTVGGATIFITNIERFEKV